jgi:DNA-binding LytR/AlgR family response regulator
MNRIKCLVVDDEPLAMDVLENYIRQLDTLELTGRCSNALDALSFLQKNKVDLVFLDIQMPKLTGIDFLKTLRNPPKIIFTTAYRDYALEGFELNVLDYLLKPVSFERFIIAVNKYHAYTPATNLPPAIAPHVTAVNEEPFIYLKADKKMVKVFLKDILYIESLKDYVKVKTQDKDIVTYQKISYLEEKLPDEKFIRIHRSYIIAVDKIKSFNTSFIDIGSEEIPIGRLYKPEVMKALGVAEG